MTRAETDQPTRVLVTTSFGPCLVLNHLELVDEDPDILGSGLQVFTLEQYEKMKGLEPKERQRFWNMNLRALADEREKRRLDPGRTIYWPWRDSTYTTLVARQAPEVPS